ncbi:MAG: TetR/AcrR family transcriptional regulator C-terminal domain-containing protein, partial [Rhodospirillaceae bacterium]|nr:TetR/AcrR family transcriptional regulator C-terminal domain-containing protein [Rhodospirillaceae bacterium]
KQGLWQALVQERTQQLTAPLRDPSPAVHDNPREVLLQMARSLMNLVRSPECGGAYRLILSEGGRTPELAQAMYENGPAACQRQVAAYLREQTARGALNVPDPELAAEQFGNLVGGDLALQNTCGMAPKHTPAEIERRLAAAVDMFLRAYASSVPAH